LISDRVCNISLSTLKSSPYSLVKGESVYAKIISTNIYGDSVLYSDPGNGALIQLVPDAPVALTNDPLTTIDTLIRFTWSQGASNGGANVLEYSVYYD
jgi:hypothetical protein